MRWGHTFPKGICPKVNVIARLEYELAYYDSAVHRFNHYTTRTPPLEDQCVQCDMMMMMMMIDLWQSRQSEISRTGCFSSVNKEITGKQAMSGCKQIAWITNRNDALVLWNYIYTATHVHSLSLSANCSLNKVKTEATSGAPATRG